MYLKKGNLAAVGFEPTPPKRLVPKTSALDHSATLPDMETQAFLTSLHFIGSELVVGVYLHQAKVHYKMLKEKHYKLDKT